MSRGAASVDAPIPARIPLRSGDEYDALTVGGRRVCIFRAGDRKAAKRGYMRRPPRGKETPARGRLRSDDAGITPVADPSGQ
jgi:hypothetical protein